VLVMHRDQILAGLRERIVAFVTLRATRDAAQDVAQEVLLLLHEKYPHVTALDELVPLSLQIARFKLLDAHRKALRRGEYHQVPVEALQLADPRGNPGLEAEQKQLLERLLTAIAALGERCRRLFQWKLEGKTFPEMQRLLDAPSVNTVYTWDFRCRKALLESMGGSWDAP